MVKHIPIYTLLLLLVFASCSSNNYNPSINFYYWKTNFKLTNNEQEILRMNHSKKIYVRYFDITTKVINDSIVAVPETPVIFSNAKDIKDINIIPTIFIQNKVMLHKHIDVEDLALKTWRQILAINKANDIEIKNIQVDCDWSEKSKERFFEYIKILKEKSNLNIESTIRLHQIKYPSITGIPPVDTPILMYYNMGDINSVYCNYIFDENITDKYKKSITKHPLPLKVAIPIYSWIVHKRNGKIIATYPKYDVAELLNNKKIIKTNEYFYTVKENHIFWNNTFKVNDEIKIEAISKKQLATIINDIKTQFKNLPKEIIIYDLDEKNFTNNNINYEEIKKMVSH
jgi:hypothetical protein